jgi:protein-disulfide isomerase-like protein with CxxC motif
VILTVGGMLAGTGRSAKVMPAQRSEAFTDWRHVRSVAVPGGIVVLVGPR